MIKDKEFAERQARFFHMDSIWDDDDKDIDGEELLKRIDSYPLKDEINSLLVLPYVDHTAGLSFQTVAACLLKENSLIIYKRADGFQSMSNSRFDAVEDFEFEYLEDLNIIADFDIDEYTSHARDVFKHYNNDKKIVVLRLLDFLDDARNQEYPDDLLVFFFKKGCNPEGMWVRCEDYDDNHNIIGRLLNQPNQNMGVNVGDMVKFSFAKNEDGQMVCFSELD